MLSNGINITASKVIFHLAGHTIKSTDCDLTKNISGISVQGVSGVLIDGGTVRGFNDGVFLDSFSSNSRVSGMTTIGACAFGMAVEGQNNQVDTSVVTESEIDGIGLGAASGTIITANDISGNVRLGVDISNFSNNNVVENNVINNNGIIAGEQGGVAVFNGTNNVIRNNAINHNFDGILIESPGNLARDNTVNGNSSTGISISTVGAPSTVRRNTVLGSGVTDMSDASASCDANTWKNNTFATDLVVGMSDGGPAARCIR